MTARKRKRAAYLIFATILVIGGLFVCGSILQQIRDQELLAAIKRGDRAGVLRLLDSGADPNVRSDMSTPLSLRDMVALFLRRQPLAQATSSKHSVPALSAYIQQYQNTDVFDVTNEDTVITEALLRHGAKVDATDEVGQTALAWAVGLRRNRTARLLLDRGADPNTWVKYGGGRTWTISKVGKLRRLLLSSWPGPALNMALTSSMDEGDNAELARMLIEHGAFMSSTDANGRTPLMKAAMSGDRWAVRTILTHMPIADIKVQGHDVLRLFHEREGGTDQSRGMGDPEVKQMLLGAGAKE